MFPSIDLYMVQNSWEARTENKERSTTMTSNNAADYNGTL